ncbi:MAG: c-type cytochrome, partial [Planctomycetota bacterium]
MSEAPAPNGFETSAETPLWWRCMLLMVIAFTVVYLPYHHLGGRDRSAYDKHDAAEVRLTAARKDELGVIGQDTATLVKLQDQKGWLKVGRNVFKSNCVQCHAADGSGNVGPNLCDDVYKNVRKMDDILAVLNQGAGGGAMPAWKEKLSSDDIIFVSAYVASLRNSKTTG